VDAVRDTYAKQYRVIYIDGARIYYVDKDWALIRASNTSPKLSLRFEALDAVRLSAMKASMREELAKYLPDLRPF